MPEAVTASTVRAMSQRTATRTHTFTESVIRDMTRVARQYDAINLAQGFPDFPAPQLLKDAACRAIQEDVNQYAITWGTPSLRSALARKYREWYGLAVDPDSEITVTCGATEAMAVVMLAVVDPGEEVIVLEPFYENYGPDAILCDASPVFLPLLPPDFRLDPARLRSAVTPRTRAIVINTPNNPTGRVFDPNEMAAVAELCIEHDLLAITDEIYEHIVFTGRHIPLAGMPGMRERTIVISGLSKTFSVTGWRVGTIVAPPVLTGAMRKVHDFLTVGAPAPLQEACAAGLDSLGRDYYEGIARDYRERRDILWRGLRDSGFGCTLPEGAYYIMADFSALSELDDMAFSTYMARECGVAPVPGSSFYSRPERGAKLVRFAFCKQAGTLERAVERLRSFFGNP